MSRSYDASLFELVHESSGSVVADREAALNHTRTALLADDYRACCLLKERIEIAHVCTAGVAAAVRVVALRFWQLHRMSRTRLVLDELVDFANLFSADECALHTSRFVAVEIEHVAHTDELVGARTVEDDARVGHRAYLECDASREVSLDVTRDD